MAAKWKKLGLAYINQPGDSSGVLYTKPEGNSQAPRPLGSYTVKRRYAIMGVPMIAVDATLDTGEHAFGKMRADSPGYIYLFERGTKHER